MTKRKLLGVSAADFAKSVGVTYEAVMKRVKAGKFSPAAFHDDGSFDEEVARVDWFANTNPNRVQAKAADLPKPPQKNPAQHGADATEKRGEFAIKLERAEVDLEAAKIHLEKLKASTVDKEEARRAVRSLMRVFRAAMLNFANRYAADIAADVEADPVRLAGSMEEKMRLALAELAKTRAPMDGGTFGDTA